MEKERKQLAKQFDTQNQREKLKEQRLKQTRDEIVADYVKIQQNDFLKRTRRTKPLPVELETKFVLFFTKKTQE